MNFNSTFFQSVLQNVADGIVACDENGVLIFFNPALEQIHHKPMQPLRPEDWARNYNLYYADGSGLMKTEDVPLYKAWKGEKVENIEMLIIPEEGEKKYVYASGSQVKDSNGRILGAVVNMHDITELKNSHQRLNEIRHFTEKISDTTPALITVFNGGTGTYRYVSKAAKGILGYSAEDILNGGYPFIVSLLHPEDGPRILEENLKAISIANEKYPDYNDNEAVEFEYRMKHKNGDYIWVHTYGVVFGRDKNNCVEEILNVTVDTTERKNAELRAQQFKMSTEYFHDLADQSPFMIWKVDSKGLCSYVNKPWCDFTGLTFEESLDLGWGKALHPDEAGREYEKFMNCFNESKPYHSKFRLKTKEGEYRWVLAQCNPVQQKEKGYIGSLTDITEQEAAQEAMQLLMTRKDEFISMASHELKTPVTSLKAFTQILQMTVEEKGDIQASEMLLKMDKQINKLTRLITDLLDASKANAGQMEMQYDKDEFDFNELVKEVTVEMQRTIPLHTIQLDLSATQRVRGDRNRVGQVLTNLISNAVKYSPGAEEIIVSTSQQDNTIKCCVRDFGIGIPMDQQSKIFTRFFRVSEIKNNTFPGLGLGLYITHEIIKRHKGILEFSSEEGKGSVFCFMLPSEK